MDGASKETPCISLHKSQGTHQAGASHLFTWDTDNFR